MARGSDVIEDLRPFDPTFYAGDPYPVYARLRREDPVHLVEDGVWALLRHADVFEVSRQPELYCSRHGVLPMDGERLGEEELLGFCMTLLVAANEAMRHLSAGGTYALAQHPEERARLVDD